MKLYRIERDDEYWAMLYDNLGYFWFEHVLPARNAMAQEEPMEQVHEGWQSVLATTVQPLLFVFSLLLLPPWCCSLVVVSGVVMLRSNMRCVVVLLDRFVSTSQFSGILKRSA